MSDAAIILQARMGSTRLPGKVLRRIGHHTLLGHCVRRLRAAHVGPVIVATTRDAADDAVEAEATRLGCGVFRGEAEDVLARYIAAAAPLGVRYVIRATADNPCVDTDGVARLLAGVQRAGAEYGLEQGLPVGAATEVVATHTLRRVGDLATEASDREHVTLYIKRHQYAFQVWLPDAPAEVRRPDLRITVDTPDDFAFMRAVIQHVDHGTCPPPLTDVIVAADALLSLQRAA